MTPEALTAATIKAAASIKARLKTIGIQTPEWFTEETAKIIAKEINATP